MNSNQVVIITAARRGIGAGCAKELAAQGYTVSLIARSPEVLDLATELGGIAIQGSIANTDDLERLVKSTLEKFGQIDAVINSFGAPPRPDLLDISDKMWMGILKCCF